MKFIAITSRLVCEESYNENREALACEWGGFFKEYLSEFLPLPLCYEIPFSHYLDNLKENLAGVILSGGGDIRATFENSNLIESKNKNSKNNAFLLAKKRDSYERQILQTAQKINLPLLGICRGAQFIATEFGAKLEKINNHIGTHKVFFDEKNLNLALDLIKNKAQNTTFIKADSIESENIECKNDFLVNSFHNFALKSLKAPLKPLAFAQDGSIESYISDKAPIFGIMWHIERENGMQNQAIFKLWKNLLH